MARINEFAFLSSNGIDKIHAVEWLPENGPPRAVLQIAHGIAEHIKRYGDFASFLAEHGFAVVGNDHLGHGQSCKSPECLGFFAETNGWFTAVADMHLLYEAARKKWECLPYFLMGHSMGSFLARTYLTQYTGELSGCILSGTGQQSRALCSLGLAITNMEKARLGKRGRSKLVYNLLFGAYNNHFKPVRTPADWISRDTQMVDDYIKDENCGFIPTLGLVSDMLGGIRYITDEKNLLKMQKDLPVYFFSGEEDPVGSFGKGVKKAYASFRKAGCTNVSCKLYPGGRHEMLNETNREEVYEDVLRWLEKQMPS